MSSNLWKSVGLGLAALTSFGNTGDVYQNINYPTYNHQRRIEDITSSIGYYDSSTTNQGPEVRTEERVTSLEVKVSYIEKQLDDLTNVVRKDDLNRLESNIDKTLNLIISEIRDLRSDVKENNKVLATLKGEISIIRWAIPIIISLLVSLFTVGFINVLPKLLNK